MLGENGRAIAAYVAGTAARSFPPDILDAARLCLADWLGVAIGAGAEAAGRVVRRTIADWHCAGKATVLFGGTAAAPLAALANGTLAHCLDFDDTYTEAVTHTSAPVWAATLALGEEAGAGEPDMLAAFVTGFEVAACIGRGLGQAVTARGWHGTGVFGRLGAAAASAALLRLDRQHALHALALAATQTSGLTGSFGTMAKPFHAGKAGSDGVMAAQLAGHGMVGATTLLEPGGGLDNAVIQDRSLQIAAPDFSGWRIRDNSFKPYAACHLIHPSLDAARRALADGASPLSIRAVRANVGALAAQVTGRTDAHPDTALKAKFDLRYCIALALHGHDASAADFRDPWHTDPVIAALAEKVTVNADPAMSFVSAALEIWTDRDAPLTAFVPNAKGHPGNPMSWDDMRQKFEALVAPHLNNRTGELFDLARGFGGGSSLPAIRAIVQRLPTWT